MISLFRNVVLSGQEPLDELSIVGYTEEPDLVSLFENAVTVCEYFCRHYTQLQNNL